MLFTSQLKMAMSIVLSMMLIPLGIGVYLHAARAGTPAPASTTPLGNAPAAPVGQPGIADVQGTWVYVSAEVSGKLAPLGADPTKVVIKGNEAHILSNGLDTVQMLLLDGSHDPAWFDATTTKGGRIQTTLGIYSIAGDELRICSSNIGGPRPGEFTTRAGDARRLATLKRLSGSTTLPAAPALRMADIMNMRTIGITIVQYSEKHNGLCPPDFGTLVRSGLLKPEVFVSAEAGTQVPSGMNLDQLAHWVTDNSDYVYAGAKMNLSQVKSPTTILAYDKDTNRGGKAINILFADGHIQVYDYVQAHGLIDEIAKDQGL